MSKTSSTTKKVKKAKTPRKLPFPDKDIVIGRVHYWAAGALRQAQRLDALLRFQLKYGEAPSKWTAQQLREQHDANILSSWGDLVEVLECDFLVHAIRQLLLWLVQARQHQVLSAAAIGRFEKAMGQVKDLRDMLHHEDEYLAGLGRKQTEYAVAYGPMLVSAHSIVVQGDDDSVGGRLSVPKALAELPRLIAAIEAARSQPKPTGMAINVVLA